MCPRVPPLHAVVRDPALPGWGPVRDNRSRSLQPGPRGRGSGARGGAGPGGARRVPRPHLPLRPGRRTLSLRNLSGARATHGPAPRPKAAGPAPVACLPPSRVPRLRRPNGGRDRRLVPPARAGG